MNKTVINVVAWLMAALPLSSFCQKTEITPLNIGDQCPDFPITNLLRYDKDSLELSDLRGKVLILDFWATWCAPCLNAFPKLDSIKKKFAGEVEVITVTKEGKGLIERFLTSNEIMQNVDLPISVENQLLSRYFTYRMIPHTVIIDGEGKVAAITEPGHITQENIKNLIERKDASIPLKKDVFDFTSKMPFFYGGGLGHANYHTIENVKFTSILTDRIEGLPGIGGGYFVADGYARIFSTNASIPQLYRSVLARKFRPYWFSNDPEYYLRFPGATVWESKNDDLYSFEIKDGKYKFLDVPRFCWELVIQKDDSLMLPQLAIDDLNRYFGTLYGVKGSIEVRKVKCLALVRTSKEDLLKYERGEKALIIDSVKNKIQVCGLPLSEFMFSLISFHHYSHAIPIIDETGYSDLVNILISANPNDFTSLNKGLSKYGLQFREVKRKIKVIVIKDI